MPRKEPRVNREIIADYGWYTSLLEDRKTIDTPVIYVRNNKDSHAAWKYQSVYASMEPIGQVYFGVEVKTKNPKRFKFRLTCHHLTEEPFFRFDSSGQPHWNRSSKVNFKEEMVSTPHFQKFTDEGIMIAYKTEKLLDENESLALEDISMCVIHFCHESNMRLNEDDFPTISLILDEQISLFEPEPEGDPTRKFKYE
ncbi:hypothetical protein [Larkinella punicea]|uniref:Uncharacterized protein n=1 Tax=Larkinella punicea TaxID=2315727 RepID=A0A368JLW5_9BACT|nr:hypothetical protein [Larkinella punicea]RCR68285.1 hypothetical protein DUE52_17980 [Larkinella punicea]